MEMNRPTVTELIAQGEAALSGGDWAGAAKAYEALVQLQPDLAEPRYKLARAYEQLGRLQDMGDVLSDPAVAGLPQAKRILASAYMTAKDYSAALPLIRDLLSASPEDQKLRKWKERSEEKLSSRRIAAALQQGKALASEERFDEAERVYLDLLAEQPNAAGAHSRLAQIYMVQKRWEDAIAPLRSALALEPGDEEVRTSLARALFKNGQPGEVLAALVSLDACSGNPDALFLLQRSSMEVGDWKLVEEAGARLLSLLPPDDPLRPRVSELAEDAAVERQSLAFDALAESGAEDQAISGYRELVHRFPGSPVALLRLGLALANCGRDVQALEALRKYLELRPHDMDARRVLTLTVVRTSDEQDVLKYVQEAVAQDQGDYEAYRWLGRYQADCGEWEASLQSLREALALEPQSPSARLGIARALTSLNRRSEALSELEVLIASGAKLFEALQTKADILVQLGRLDDAIALYERALEEAPKHPLISYKLGNALLLKGDVGGFHRLNDRRRELDSFIEGERQRPFSDWGGQLSIEGKLLVWAEAGFSAGQNILHMSVLGLLAGLGLDIVLEVPAGLEAICRRSFPWAEVTTSGRELPAGISHHAPIGSLSRWFKPDLASFRSMRPYLAPDRETALAHRRRLQSAAGEGGLLVGICLEAADNMPEDAASVHPVKFWDAMSLSGVRFVNIQPGQQPHLVGSAADLAQRSIVDGGRGESGDLDERLSVLSAQDLIVCTDGVTAHLGGAAGLNVFVLLQAAPPPYWLAEGDRCIWYPKLRLFRRSHLDRDWVPALGQLRDAVGDFAGRYDPGSWPGGATSQPLAPFEAEEPALTPEEIGDAVRSFVGQGPSAPTAFTSALELIGRLPPDRLTRDMIMLRGDLLVRFGRWQEARSVYASLLPAEGEDSEVRAKLLSVSLAMHDLEPALSDARRLAGQDSGYRLTTANILYHLRRRDEALEELRSASLQGVHPDRLNVLFGTLLLEKAEFARAEAYLKDQIAMTCHPDLLTLLGRSLSGQGRHQEALTIFDRAVSIVQDDPNANFWRTQERIASGLASSVPLPPLQGEVPQVGPDDVVTFFVADSSYFWQHGLVLLGSLGRRSSGTRCHVHVINPDEGVAPAIQRIREMLPDLRLTYSYEHGDFEGSSDDYIRTYSASVRFVRLAQIFAGAPATYLSLDADCVVRGDIVADGLGLADVGVRMRFDDRPHATVAAGALKLRPTDAAAKFIDKAAMLIRSTLETGEAVWFLDQIVLSHALRELGEGEITIDQLGMTYIDWFFQSQSLIWTGKGPRKLVDTSYTDELSKFRYLQEDQRISALMPELSDRADEG